MIWRVASAGGLGLLTVALTCVLIKGLAIDTPAYRQAVRALDAFRIANASVDRAVLGLRAGLVQNYDPLSRDLVALRDALAALQTGAPFPALDALAAAASLKEQLSEEFKSNNALVANAITDLDSLGGTLEMTAGDNSVGPSVARLRSAVLQLTRGVSDEGIQMVQKHLDAVLQQGASIPDQAALQRLIAHGRMLMIVLPVVDKTVRRLLATPADGQLAAVSAVFDQQHAELTRRTRTYWVGLYTVALAMLVLLTQLGLRLRADRIALSRRAALERAIAHVSTGLINCSPDQIDSHIKRALADIALCIGMDRAYVAVRPPDDCDDEIYAWPGTAEVWRGWPEQALALALTGYLARKIYVARVDRLPPSRLRAGLTAGAVCGWACTEIAAGSAGRGILAFESVTLKPIWPERELASLRLAASALAGVLGRRSLEARRAALELRIQQAQRMEAVGTLASGIAHNFNNIIGAIAGRAEMAEAQIAGGGVAAGHVREISRAAGRARDVVGQILAFGKRPGLQARACVAAVLLAETASLFRATQRGGIVLHTYDRSERARLWADFAQLQQVIFNLCSNAAQAMDGVGDIHVGLDVQETKARRLLHGTLDRGRYVRLVVSDCGHGMDAATLKRAFEPFFTTREAGTGLGLATVLDIVREHLGAIDVQSRVGDGTRFEVWLPCLAEADDAATIPTPHPGDFCSVLLLDADAPSRLRSEEILATLGYEPGGFETAAEALAACHDEPGRFDVMIVDHDVPETSVRLVSAAMPGCPILLAARSDAELSPRLLAETGVAEIVRKPFSGAELAGALSRCLTQRSRTIAPAQPSGDAGLARASGTGRWPPPRPPPSMSCSSPDLREARQAADDVGGEISLLAPDRRFARDSRV